jgi:hypothetical protein
MKSESKRQLVETQRKVINPIMNKTAFRTPDEIPEMVLDYLWTQCKNQKLI